MSVDGINKAMQGLTTIEEVFRVAPPEVVVGSSQTLVIDTSVLEEGLRKNDALSASPSSITTVSPTKILVVDDNAVVLKLLSHLLKSEDYLVVTAKNGIEALKLASTERPNLIVTDYMMPEMDGVALIKKLKSQMSTRFIPIIMLTAKNEEESEVEGLDAGADDYLTKPVARKRFLARVARLLNRSGNGNTP